jgi:hypothetical protein
MVTVLHAPALVQVLLLAPPPEFTPLSSHPNVQTAIIAAANSTGVARNAPAMETVRFIPELIKYLLYRFNYC